MTKDVSIFGLTVRVPDALSLPLASAAVGASCELEVIVGSMPAPETTQVLDGAVRLEYQGCRVGVAALQPLGPLSLEHYIVDHAIPNGLSRLGALVLHAAGVCRGPQGVLISGDSGQGKSTLALHLLRHGWTLLGDDAVRIEQNRADGVRAWSSYAGIRVHQTVLDKGIARPEDAGALVAEYATKRRLRPETLAFEHQSAAVQRLVILGADGPFRVRPLGAAERCGALATHWLIPEADPRDAVRRLDQTAPFAARLAGWQVDYRRTPAGADAVCEWLDGMSN